MKKEDEGRILTRGRRKIELVKLEDAFTAKIREPADAERLRAEEGVRSVERLTKSVVQVKVAAETKRAEARDQVMERLRKRGGLVIHHEYADRANPTATYRITDQIIVKFRPGTGNAAIGSILEESGVVIRKAYPNLGECFLLEVTDAAGANPVKVANRLEERAEVEYAEPCLLNRFIQSAFPADERFAHQWHLHSADADAPDIDPNADASVYPAWQITKGSRQVVVAVLDDGFELSHPDFHGEEKIVHPTDFTGNDDRPYPGSGDYHGTPCAGVAIAEENGQFCVGVAPGCAFMPVRFPLDASDAWLIEIFEYVSARAHIASCSWGPSPGDYPLGSAVSETFTRLIHSGGKDGRGLAIVFAAGNYDAPLDTSVDYTIHWLGRDIFGNLGIQEATGRIHNGSAAHPDTIVVSACTSLNRKSLYSNWGREITVAAPSDNFDPITYDDLTGRGITTVDNEYYGDDFSPGKRYTDSFGGTSSAAPLVAGVCALVKSTNPQLSALEIKAILEQTADKVEDPSSDAIYGHAKGTYQDGHSEWFGYGKVDAHRAVQAAVGRIAPQTIVERESTTPLAIPDHFAPGVSSVLEIVQGGPVVDIAVDVDIEHTWIGDLELALVSSQGTRVLLHDRAGGSRDHIRRTYTPADTPALEAVINEAAAGEWSLSVADRARYDEGTLSRWSLRLTLGRDGAVRVRSTQNMTIPDDDPLGIASELSVSRSGRLRDIRVEVDITHSWIGDLHVSLVAPSGREVVLHDRTGGGADNILESYDGARIPELAVLSEEGVEVQGTWTLKAADLAQRDLGKLNAWGLELSVE